MPRTRHPLSPPLSKLATELGLRIERARCRRNFSSTLFAERIGISRNTLTRVEAGDPAVALGTYLKALWVLGLDGDINDVANNDEVGRKLQDAASLGKRRHSTTTSSSGMKG